MKKITLFLILLFVSLAVFAQRERIKLGTKYSVAKIYLKDNTIKKINNLIINENGIASFMELSGKSEKIPIEDFRLVKIKTGSNTLAYGLYGAGVMAAASLLAVLEVESDPYMETKEDVGAIIAGLIIGGGLVGAIIGAASPKWKTFNLPKIKNKESLSYNLLPVYNPINKAISLRLNINL